MGLMTYKNIIISLIIITVAGVAFWTSYILYKPETVTAAPTSNLPDAIMEEVSAVFMDKLGKPTMKIISPKLVHYPDSDRTELTLPQLTLYKNSVEPWYITSKFAKAIDSTEIVDFWEDVTIHHAADANNPATLIKTPTLRVHPNKKTAETTDLITLSQPNVVVKATGMHADMNTGDIKLLSEARGEYVPSS